MAKDDLRRFLIEMLLGDHDADSEEFAVVGELIRLTLGYRDRWKIAKDEILTVEDTRRALDIYEQVIKTGEFPTDLDEKIGGLVKLWLKKINRLFF